MPARLNSGLQMFEGQIQEDANALKKRLASDILEGVIRRTPVDTGHLKSQWQVFAGAANPQETDDVDPSGAGTLATGDLVIASAREGQPITIANPAPYARRIEHGHSRQAPQGMLGLAIMDAVGRP